MRMPLRVKRAAWRQAEVPSAKCESPASPSLLLLPRLSVFARPIRALGPYLVAVFACMAVLIGSLRLWRADLHIPFVYSGDQLAVQAWIKGLIDNPWYLHNHFLGAPGTMEMEDYPVADSLHFLLLKAISLASKDSAFVLNVYFLLTFPLATLSALMVFRRFQVSYGPALVGSLLFAFTPYHFFRGESHLFLSAYFLIPFAIMLALRICRGWNLRKLGWEGEGPPDPPTSPARREPRPPEGAEAQKNWLNLELVASLVLCILIGAGGIYYAFFSSCLLLAAGIWAALQQKALRPLLFSGTLVFVISLSVFAQMVPTFLYSARHGTNSEAVCRNILEVEELYSLKIDNLLFPMPGHRLQNFFHLPYTPGYNYGTNLGVMASLGFLMVLAGFLFRRSKVSPCTLVDSLGMLTMVCLLLATVGGFGYLFSAIVTPWIRCYYRLSIFIAFLSLFGFVLVLDRFVMPPSGAIRRKLLYIAVLLLIAGVGLLDQTSKTFIPPYGLLRAEFQNDKDFVQRIEARLPGQVIFQLPHVPFPEIMLRQTICSDHLRGYVHSKSLRWSGGAIKGRPADYWTREVSHQPPETMLRTLGLAGFGGIYLDRNGYADHGAALEAQLTRLLGSPPVISGNQRLVFFDLTAHNQELRRLLTSEEFEIQRADVLAPLAISISWQGGFSYLEGDPEENSRGCSAEGKVEIRNSTGRARTVTLEMGLSSADANPSNLWIDGPSFAEHVQIIAGGDRLFRKSFTLPPGRHAITFRSDGKKLDAPLEPRTLVFRVHNFRIFWMKVAEDSADYAPAVSR
jgi:phosphoglycerol transferase